MKKKIYVPPRIEKKGDTKNIVIAAVHKGCSSSTAKAKKG